MADTTNYLHWHGAGLRHAHVSGDVNLEHSHPGGDVPHEHEIREDGTFGTDRVRPKAGADLDGYVSTGGSFHYERPRAR